jgi:hypothetical protein
VMVTGVECADGQKWKDTRETWWDRPMGGKR